MTHWDELERELRLSVHPTFADKLLDNALESDNMLGAYGEIADLVATLRAPATAAELAPQADAVAEMSKLLPQRSGRHRDRCGHGEQEGDGRRRGGSVARTGLCVRSRAAGCGAGPRSERLGRTRRSGRRGQRAERRRGFGRSGVRAALPEQQGFPSSRLSSTRALRTRHRRRRLRRRRPSKARPSRSSTTRPRTQPDAPEQAREPRVREAALPVGAGAGPLNPDDGPSEPPAAGSDGEPAPPAEEPPVLTPEGPPPGPPLGSGADFQPPAPFVPPFVPVDDESDGGGRARARRGHRQ